MASSSSQAGLSPQMKAGIALGVTIPVIILGLLLAYIWTLRRRLRKQGACEEEEAFGDFKVNCVHKLVKIEDVEARTLSSPKSLESIVSSLHNPAVEADSDHANVQQPRSIPESTVVSVSVPASTPAQGSISIDPPRYSDKQVAPDPILPEVVSGPHYGGREALIISRITDKAEVKEEKKPKTKQERLTADEIIGIDKRFSLQDLPAYQAGRPPCLHVATANLGQPNTFVSPWDVEFKPNPFIFSHLTTPGGTLDPVTPVSAISSNSPTSPTPNELQGPFEMDAVETEFNPWRHPPRTLIHGVPHRWEKTIGTDRMFFEAEHNRKRRNSADHDELVEVPRRRWKGQRVGSESYDFSSPGSTSASDDTPTICVPGPSSRHDQHQMADWVTSQWPIDQSEEGTATADVIAAYSEDQRSPSSIALDDFLEEPEWIPGDDRQWQPTTGKEPELDTTAWSDMDLSFVTQLAASHEQQVRFFDKFHKHPMSPISPVSIMNRGHLSFDGESSAASTPRSSLRSRNSNLTPVTPITPLSSVGNSIFEGRTATGPLSASPVTTTSVGNAPFKCSKCDDRFRTPGLLKNHFNRKHNLRYACILCSAAFGLRKDLERHETTVHKVVFPSTVRLFCPNPGCATPSKEFNRKDNFKRHVERCREAVATRGTAR